MSAKVFTRAKAATLASRKKQRRFRRPPSKYFKHYFVKRQDSGFIILTSPVNAAITVEAVSFCLVSDGV